MATELYIYFPSADDMPVRGGMEIEVETFFGRAAKPTGGGGGEAGYNLDFALVPGEDVEPWLPRLLNNLARSGDARVQVMCPST